MKPIVPAGRVVGLDAARALALLGMMATHILVGVDADGVTLPQQIAGGRASALFAVLAGVSLALMTGGTTPPRGRRRFVLSAGLAVRALLVALVGLLLGEVDSGIAVILTYYGLLFLLGLPFLGLRTRPLVVLAGGWLLVVPVLSTCSARTCRRRRTPARASRRWPTRRSCSASSRSPATTRRCRGWPTCSRASRSAGSTCAGRVRRARWWSGERCWPWSARWCRGRCSTGPG